MFVVMYIYNNRKTRIRNDGVGGSNPLVGTSYSEVFSEFKCHFPVGGTLMGHLSVGIRVTHNAVSGV